MSEEYAALDAVAQAELVARGEVTPIELVDASIERIERLNPLLNSVIFSRYENARQEAKALARGDAPFFGAHSC